MTIHQQIIDREDARSQELKRYFTGISCNHNHISERRVSDGTCIICNEIYESNRSEYKREYAIAHKDTRLKYLQDNKEHITKINRNYQRENVEDIKSNRQDYYQQNKIKILQQTSKYGKSWRRKNKGKVNAYTYNYRAKKLQAKPVWADEDAIQAIYDDSSNRENKTHVDHVIPLQGEIVCGLHVETNLQILDAAENISKYNHIDQEAESIYQLQLTKSLMRTK